MAAIGDILVKFVADFAEFTKGMAEGQKQLTGFADQAAKSGKAVEASFEQLKNVVKGLGVYEAFNQLSEAADKVQESVLKIADGAKALDINTDAFQGLKQAARDAGVGLDQASAMFQRFQQQLQSAASGNKAAIDSFNSLGIKILDSNGKVRDATELFTQFAQRINSLAPGQRGLIEQALIGSSGTSADKLLAQLSGGFDQATESARKLGTYIDQSVVQEMEELNKRLDLQKDKWDAFWAPIVANTKLTALEAVNNLTDAIKTSLAAAKPYETVFDKAIAFLNTSKAVAAPLDTSTGLPADLTDTASIVAGKMGEVKSDSQAITDTWKTSLDQINQKQAELATKAVEMNDRVAEMVRQLGFADSRTQDMIVSQRNLYAEIDKNAAKARDLANALIDAAAKAGASEYPPPPPVSPADFGRKDWGNPKSPTPTATGGGGSKTDVDNIQSQIDRYNGLQKAAQAAYETVNNGAAQNIDDLKRQVAVQQQVDDIVAKLIAKHQQVSAIQKQELYDAVSGYEQERAAAQHLLDVQVQAVATDKQYGDGKQALQKITKDLAEQINSQRLSVEAATRAFKDFKEQQDQAALAAKRFDDDMGSFGAGIEHAAQAQARANDLYAMGEATFNSMSDAMIEGMKALSGQASKSFGEIALSFAQMIEQMAMKELAAQTIGFIIKGIGMVAGAGVGGVTPGAVSPSDWAAMLSANTGGNIAGVRAAGGPVDAGKPYLVGEQGAELFVPAAAGNIVPASGVSSAGGVTVNVDMSGGGTSDPKQATDFGRKVKEAVVNVIANEKRPGGTLYMRRSA